MANNDTIKSQVQPFSGDWQQGFDPNLKRPDPKSDYLGGANFDATLDELLFNRMLQLKNLHSSLAPQGNDTGKIYYQKDTQKYKMWIGKALGGWVDIQYTSTSTSSTSSSSSSTSTSSTSSSTSTT